MLSYLCDNCGNAMPDAAGPLRLPTTIGKLSVEVMVVPERPGHFCVTCLQRVLGTGLDEKEINRRADLEVARTLSVAVSEALAVAETETQKRLAAQVVEAAA